MRKYLSGTILIVLLASSVAGCLNNTADKISEMQKEVDKYLDDKKLNFNHFAWEQGYFPDTTQRCVAILSLGEFGCQDKK